MKRTPATPKMDAEMLLEAAKLSAPEARFLVANYYDAQDQRKRADMQLRHLGDKPAMVLHFTADNHAGVERQVQRALQQYAEGSLVGRWCLSHIGVGPVITAGLIAHLNIEVAPTAGHFMRFAGLDPTRKWIGSVAAQKLVADTIKAQKIKKPNEDTVRLICQQTSHKYDNLLNFATHDKKGKRVALSVANLSAAVAKRPYNAAMKQLIFHLGECFKRSSNHPDSYYGALYRERKALLVERNEAGHFAERARTFVTKSADVRETLAEGKLPNSNLDRQACNWAAKIFLCHLHAVMFWDHYKKAPPKPFAIVHLGHAHEIKVQNCEMFPGFERAYYGAFAEAAE